MVYSLGVLGNLENPREVKCGSSLTAWWPSTRYGENYARATIERHIVFVYSVSKCNTHTVVARETGEEEVKGLQPQQHFGSILFLPQQLEL